MNQQLEIENVYRGSVVPVLSFSALDKNRQVLPQVKVSTVYGSDRGNLVAPYVRDEHRHPAVLRPWRA
ncbi:hypothetical protein OG735_01470 [Streptomyces sp. NBC_01210]|uniref:hypothetical protein n=2 Tax=unclassified Streptomyces TaxID=2593676 RepID=UPI002E10C2E6|nr:hypothetical protein OG735_01470 [Streptomyces sp. NBC_01210]